jgi:prevent-host-death family protein
MNGVIIMPLIRPVSDLRNKTPEIEEICLKEQKPVFITKNGHSHLVVMSQKLYEEQQALMELYEKLDEAEAQSAAGAVRIPHREVMARLRTRLHG